MAGVRKMHQFRLRQVPEYLLQKYVKSVNKDGNVTAGTFEEFEFYLQKTESEFYEVVEDGSSPRVVAAICVIFNGNRKISTGIGMNVTDMMNRKTYNLSEAEIDNLIGSSCVNIPDNIRLPRLLQGHRYYNIMEYYIGYSDIETPLSVDNWTEYDLIGIEYYLDYLDCILKFDFELFGLGHRRDFLESCFLRSDFALIVTFRGDIKAFGVLSKPTRQRRLLGPVYVMSGISAEIVLGTILTLAKTTYPANEIVAYISEGSPGRTVLRSKGFRPRGPLKTWKRYSSCYNFNIAGKYIVTLGSLLFDVC